MKEEGESSSMIIDLRFEPTQSSFPVEKKSYGDVRLWDEMHATWKLLIQAKVRDGSFLTLDSVMEQQWQLYLNNKCQ